LKRKMDVHIVRYMLLAAALVLGILYFDVIIAGAKGLWGILTPLILGAVFAYILNIVMRKLEKIYFPRSDKKWVTASRRPVCMVLALLMILLVIALILLLVIPELTKTFVLIGQEIPVFVENVTAWVLTYSDEFPAIEEELQNLQIDWKTLGDNVWSYLKTGVSGLLNSTVSIVGSVFGAVVNFVISLIFCIYILSSKEKLGDQLHRLVRAYVPEKWAKRGWTFIRTADATFSSFIIGQCIEALILGFLCTMGMLIFRFPYALMVGVFTGVTALIPVVGAYLGAAVGAFMILTVDPVKALLFIVFILVLQQIEGNVIYPKVVGNSIGLPGLWVLAAVTVGSGFMGVLGMLLGVPAAATLYKLLGQHVNARNMALDLKEAAATEAVMIEAAEAAATEAVAAGSDKVKKDDGGDIGDSSEKAAD